VHSNGVREPGDETATDLRSAAQTLVLHRTPAGQRKARHAKST
jgi:hypothetical protein